MESATFAKSFLKSGNQCCQLLSADKKKSAEVEKIRLIWSLFLYLLKRETKNTRNSLKILLLKLLKRQKNYLDKYLKNIFPTKGITLVCQL
jgi:hypothetical protein